MEGRIALEYFSLQDVHGKFYAIPVLASTSSFRD